MNTALTNPRKAKVDVDRFVFFQIPFDSFHISQNTCVFLLAKRHLGPIWSRTYWSEDLKNLRSVNNH